MTIDDRERERPATSGTRDGGPDRRSTLTGMSAAVVGAILSSADKAFSQARIEVGATNSVLPAPNLTLQIAEYAASTSFKRLPPAVVEHAKKVVFDEMASAASCSRMRHPRRVQTAACAGANERWVMRARKDYTLHIRKRDMHLWLAATFGVLVPILATAQPATRPVVGELFTSEGCSSCPPADAKIAELARTRPDLLLLTFHVTYWNGLGWHDPYSFDAATQRQRRYVALGVSPQVYTPAFIVDGKFDAVGSDPAAVDNTLRHAALSQENAATIEVRRGPAGVSVFVGAGVGNGTILLIGYDRLHQTSVSRGENTGRTLEEANIVRSISILGDWSGRAVRLQAPHPAGEAVAVILQRDDGHVLGAAIAGASSSPL